MKKYKGEIFSGIGVAQTRVLDNLDLYERKTGIQFYPGTLNIKLEEEFLLPDNTIFISSEEVTTTGRNSDVSLIPAKILNKDVFIFYPYNPMYDRNILEIMAPFNIRDKYDLKDGDTLEIFV